MQNPPPFPDLPSGATVAQYLTRKWGVKTRLIPLQTVAVLTTAVRVLRNNPRRFGLTILNVGTSNVYVDWNGAVAVGQGVLLTPLGGTLTLVVDEDGELLTYDVWAIAAAAGNNLSVWETESL